MQAYELSLVLKEGTTRPKVKAAQEKLEKILSLLKGKMVGVEDWGEKGVYVKVGKESSGILLHFVLELEEKNVSELKSKLKMEEEIIRYLLVRRE